jgi:aerobic-type carbon monoxide dehydrogenase small subunit (CoxS/CutS family)
MNGLPQPSGDPDAPPSRRIRLVLNGGEADELIEDRMLLVHALRDRFGLTGTHVGCNNGDCGACTVEIDGRIAKSCLVMAAAADGCSITTIEGLADPDGSLSPLQEAFWDQDAVQCGFCLPGHLFVARDLLDRERDPSEEQIRTALTGNICRCTGYTNIVEAIRVAAERARG